MISYLFAFIFGLLTPAMASRYPKAWASDLGEWLFNLWHKPCFVKVQNDKKRTLLLAQKWRKMAYYSVLWALLLTALFVAVDLLCPLSARVWCKAFICIVALLTTIDDLFYVLPDIFTVPLIVLGFGYALYGGIISPENSFYGALYGLFLPSFSVLITSVFFKNAFGGGDVKMLMGLGAWLGVLPLCLALLLSVVSFGIQVLITGKHSAAYGPHLAWGGTLVLFLTNLHLISFL